MSRFGPISTAFHLDSSELKPVVVLGNRNDILGARVREKRRPFIGVELGRVEYRE